MTEHFFKTLKIENFRGIKSLEINDIARVNLFVGENNCGKTTVLEAAFLLSGINNPGLMVTMQNGRGVTLTEESDIKDFFYNRASERELVFSGAQIKGKRKLAVSPLYGNLRSGQINGFTSPSVLENGDTERAQKFPADTSMTGQSLIGIKYRFSVSDPATGKSKQYQAGAHWIEAGNPQFSVFSDKNYEESMPGKGLYLRDGYDPRLVDEMLNMKQKDLLLSALNPIDPKIKDIKTGVQKTVSIDIGLDSFIPINLLGDGIMRILNLLSGINGVPGGMLFVDEMENGLHVTAMERAWEVVLAQSEKVNAQIFMTTHSGDAIKSLRNVLDSQLLSDAVACYRLVKFPDDVVRAYRYSGEQLGMALDSDTDIRV